MAPNSNDKTENTSDEAEKNEHNTVSFPPSLGRGGDLIFCLGSKGGEWNL